MTYAFGVLSYELICSRPAWQNVSMSLLESVRNGFHPSFPQEVDKVLEGLIKECWHQHPGLRPEAATVLEALNNFCEAIHQDDSLEGEAADQDVCETDISCTPTHTESCKTQPCDSLVLESPMELQCLGSSITQLEAIKSKLKIAQYKRFQLEAIEALQCSNDAIVVQPTGSGKSLYYVCTWHQFC